MIFGLVSFFASVVYWLHDVHLCIHIGLLRLRPVGLCTGLHSCWGSIFNFTGVQHGENTGGIAGSTEVIGVGGPRRFTVDSPLWPTTDSLFG